MSAPLIEGLGRVDAPGVDATRTSALPAAASALAAPAALAMPVAPPTGVAAGSFSSWMSGELAQVNHRLVASEHGLQRLAAGESVSLHEVMMRAEEARLSLALMAQVRNRLVESYQDILRMQG